MMFVTKGALLQLFCCTVMLPSAIEMTCVRDAEGNAIRQTQSGFRLGTILHDVGCSIEKGVRRIGDSASVLGSDVKVAVQGGINFLSQPFQTKPTGNPSTDQPNNHYNMETGYSGHETFNNQQSNSMQTNYNSQPANNMEMNHNQRLTMNSNDQANNNNNLKNTEASKLPYDALIDVRAQEIFKTGMDYIETNVQNGNTEVEGVDERFLLNSPKVCPEGSKKDRHDICRRV